MPAAAAARALPGRRRQTVTDTERKLRNLLVSPEDFVLLPPL